jgi:hypothetical protein
VPPVRQPFQNEGVLASAAPAVAVRHSAIINPSEPVANHREALGRFQKRKALALAAIGSNANNVFSAPASSIK